MKVGEVRLLVVPPELGYGDQGAGRVIPPGATLVFLVELVKIMKAPAFPSIDETKIQKTASGLQYVDIAVGEGENPAAGESVAVHYSGWLRSNKNLFDSSRTRDEVFRFRVGKGEVIQGWDEGLSTMRRGGKRILIIPPELGYGQRGAGRVIPPGATLVFEVELLEIEK